MRLDLTANMIRAVMSLFYIFKNISGITDPVGILQFRLMHIEIIFEIYMPMMILYESSPFWSPPPSRAQRN